MPKSEKKKNKFLIGLFLIILLIIIIAVGVIYVHTKNSTNTSWTITQYGNYTSGQLMFYTIEGNNGGIIIVDGGYETEDTVMLATLKDVLAEYDNKVDAWILTHYDSDHAGAYMAVRDQVEDLEVGVLYVQDTPDLETCQAAASWYTDAEWDLYERYLNLSEDEKTYLYTGDVIEDVIGLKIEVLSAYDDWMEDEVTNYLNEGSIVFRLCGNEDTMLFCADTQSETVCNFLIETYGEDLKSDYLQVGHHGNNSFTDEFYELVNPSIAFFPAPISIMENTNNVSWYRAPYLKELLENMGAEIITFENSPNSIIFY